MTEQKLYERLMLYKSKHGVTQEVLQHYHWALDTLKQHPLAKSCSSQEKM